ncbi:MAG: sodium:alanine symporter family protein [Lachnospiraceae bacterium]|nr:sodium:alanine symporter family protein [Lachnospiraceae bacterium]MBQ7781185.1 sodium:alanine symporter family protein [Lachnospiraceae bacterium]
MLENIEAMLLPIVKTMNEYLSSYILIVLLVGVGLWYTVKTKFVQVRYLGAGMKKVFGSLSLKGGKQEKGMSSFQALATAIAAQVGTGNVIGASGAILTGGPGAIFWMWVIAFFGMATIYAEATLAQKTRIVDKDGNIHGGPVYYITQAFKGRFGKFLAGFFAVAIIMALGFMGCMVQSNSIGSTIETAFGIPAWVAGIVLVVICAFIFLGGVKRLAAVCEKLVPIMAAIFLLGGLVVLVLRIQYLPATVGMIFKYAFQPQAIIGGAFGAALKAAISQGAKRGLFSNEAGMGSTPHAHAQANVAHPHEQGIVAMAGVFIDTFVVLTLNALVIISTMYTSDGVLAGCGAAATSETITKSNLAQTAFGSAFSSVFGQSLGQNIGAIFVAICLFFFAFSTILGWNMFGKINVVYLFGEKRAKLATTIYTIIALVFVFLGTLASNDLVWELTDAFNYLMVLPNALALFALTAVVKGSLKEADAKKKEAKKQK